MVISRLWSTSICQGDDKINQRPQTFTFSDPTTCETMNLKGIHLKIDNGNSKRTRCARVALRGLSRTFFRTFGSPASLSWGKRFISALTSEELGGPVVSRRKPLRSSESPWLFSRPLGRVRLKRLFPSLPARGI
ncbi:hypothetical protein NDU88_004710 [Pleurodeles waltl]|uniref:Uncharacterized protein n=1 Tax=Pleurodeles waltl TaxID=8319 RepID=A0AAV7PGH1_PLEWA|nr:hypothetical protein NDU88_004710 [Pleurodeles waltl]